MKGKLYISMLILLAMPLITQVTRAQISIGSNEIPPQKGALLDFTEGYGTENPDRSLPNSTKGVLFPKVSLVSPTSLAPLFATTETPQTITSLGMVVYNVHATIDLDEGLYVWNGKEWSAIQGSGRDGVFTPDWASVQVNGTLVKSKALSTNNTITLRLNVTEKGSYSIVAFPEPNNDYYFSAKGEFRTLGSYIIVLTGTGTPKESTEGDRSGIKDNLQFFFNGATPNPAPTDLPTLLVEEIDPNYTYSCGSIDYSNVALKVGEPSIGQYITLRVTVPLSADGAHYHIETNEVDNVKFTADGNLIAGQQAIILESNEGVPTEKNMLNFFLTSNTTVYSMENCPIDIQVEEE